MFSKLLTRPSTLLHRSFSQTKSQITYRQFSALFQKDIDAGFIVASAKHDPGCRDLFGTHKKNMDKHRSEEMHNLQVVPNDGEVVSDFPEEYPHTDHLVVIEAGYKIEDQKRNYCLVIEDMQYGYEQYI